MFPKIGSPFPTLPQGLRPLQASESPSPPDVLKVLPVCLKTGSAFLQPLDTTGRCFQLHLDELRQMRAQTHGFGYPRFWHQWGVLGTEALGCQRVMVFKSLQHSVNQWWACIYFLLFLDFVTCFKHFNIAQWCLIVNKPHIWAFLGYKPAQTMVSHPGL